MMLPIIFWTFVFAQNKNTVLFDDKTVCVFIGFVGANNICPQHHIMVDLYRANVIRTYDKKLNLWGILHLSHTIFMIYSADFCSNILSIISCLLNSLYSGLA